MKEMTKQIGEEFWSEWVAQPASTDPREMRVLYKVIEIVKVAKYGDYGELVDAAKLEPIKVEHRLPKGSAVVILRAF